MVPLRLTVVALAAGLVAWIATSALAAPPKLVGTVGPGFTITLTKGGKKVTKLKAGKYAFVISDKASIHDFVLEQQSGGKFEKELTSVPFVGKKTVTVTLKKGKWKFYCSPHQSLMSGTFVVT